MRVDGLFPPNDNEKQTEYKKKKTKYFFTLYLSLKSIRPLGISIAILFAIAIYGGPPCSPLINYFVGQQALSCTVCLGNQQLYLPREAAIRR